MTVADIDHGWGALGQALQSLAGDPHVLVGVQGSKAEASHGDGVTTAQVASYNEFGTGHIPARSFIRATIDIHEHALQTLATKLGQGVLAGKLAAPQALGLLGEHALGLMITRIHDHIAPENAPSTIARKGSSTPLIAHSGLLKNSLTTQVVP
jgi:hypothetical protein